MINIKDVTLRSEKDIVETWVDKENIVVSVICHTYNQETYIEDTITGFLMQETDFAYEIIIHDDASTDGTPDIVRDYQSKYPNIIKTIFQKSNQFRLGVRPVNFTLKESKGRYVCLCEGDDYWVSPDKLSNHIEFFKFNPGYALHVYDCYEEVEGVIKRSSSKLNRLSVKHGEHSCLDVKRMPRILPLTSCFINDFEDTFPTYFHKSINGDLLLCFLLSHKGKTFVDKGKKVAVYRIHNKGIWSKASEETKFYEMCHTRLVQARYFSDEKHLGEEVLIENAFATARRIGFARFTFKFNRRLFRSIHKRIVETVHQE